MGNRPLIGITPWYNYEEGKLFIKDGYYEAIIRSGGLPVLLPLITEESLLDEYMKKCDGFLLAGGPDLDAMYYNENNMPYNGEISPDRDVMELHISKRAIEMNKPILGICRGIQVMNAALGGSLYQDIHVQVKDRNLIKHSQSAPKWYPTHNVFVEKDSKVWELFKKGQVQVNSFHHQAVKDVAPCFRITARSEDGIIEAIEHINCKFAVGVQWHPELMWQKNESFLGVFKALVKSCTG